MEVSGADELQGKSIAHLKLGLVYSVKQIVY